jgi:DNA-3-methyladenine glycosylase II
MAEGSSRENAMTSQTFTIAPQGPFSLAEAATFGFGQRSGQEWDGVMRLAFCVDGYTRQVGVEVHQDDAGLVHCNVADTAEPGGLTRTASDSAGGPQDDLEAVRRQVARVLSLDHDGTEFTKVGERDPVIGKLQQAAPGLRPPLFYSPYEAAAWSVLSARRPASQMMTVRDRLSAAHGASFDLSGQELGAFPLPEALLKVESFPGIPAEKLDRLHGVARAALDGQLDVAELLRLGPEAASTQLQRIKGIGPFYSSLIVIRGTGFADVLPVAEQTALSLCARLYGLDEPLSADAFTKLAEPWQPLRTWAIVLIRAAGPRVLDAEPDESPTAGGAEAAAA